MFSHNTKPFQCEAGFNAIASLVRADLKKGDMLKAFCFHQHGFLRQDSGAAPCTDPETRMHLQNSHLSCSDCCVHPCSKPTRMCWLSVPRENIRDLGEKLLARNSSWGVTRIFESWILRQPWRISLRIMFWYSYTFVFERDCNCMPAFVCCGSGQKLPLPFSFQVPSDLCLVEVTQQSRVYTISA